MLHVASLDEILLFHTLNHLFLSCGGYEGYRYSVLSALVKSWFHFNSVGFLILDCHRIDLIVLLFFTQLLHLALQGLKVSVYDMPIFLL